MTAQHNVGVGYTDVSQGEVRIFFDGLLVVLQTLLDPVLPPSVPEELPTQVQFVRFGTFGVVLG
jgi:hypothetical protein